MSSELKQLRDYKVGFRCCFLALLLFCSFFSICEDVRSADSLEILHFTFQLVNSQGMNKVTCLAVCALRQKKSFDFFLFQVCGVVSFLFWFALCVVIGARCLNFKSIRFSSGKGWISFVIGFTRCCFDWSFRNRQVINLDINCNDVNIKVSRGLLIPKLIFNFEIHCFSDFWFCAI